MSAKAFEGVCGADYVVEFLAKNTAERVFGVPGSSSVSIFNAVGRSSCRLVPSLQENAATAMADGYARLAGPTGLLLYMLPGVATSLSNLYNAWRDETPLVVIVSQLASASRRGQAHVGEADVVSFVEPISRFAREITDPAQLPEALAAAYRSAVGPPAGPAFLVVPEDVLLAPATNATTSLVGGRSFVTPTDIGPVVDRLATAERPLLVVGGQARRSNGSAAVEQLASELSIPIMYEPFWNDRLGVSPSHECLVGQLTERSSLAREADLVIALGCRMFNEVHPRQDPWFPDAYVVHVNDDYGKLGEASSPSWASAADVASFARMLLEQVLAAGPRDRQLLQTRSERIRLARERRKHPRPSPFNTVVQALSGELDHGYLVDESVSANFPMLAALGSKRGDRYVSTTGGSLGWGIGAACGVALATGEPVTCAVGDGAFFFGCQALWPAVVNQLPVTIVVIDNGGFGSTMYFEDQYLTSRPAAEGVRYLGSDFQQDGPSPVDVARGFGLDAETILEEQLQERLNGLRGKGPALLRVPVGLGSSPRTHEL